MVSENSWKHSTAITLFVSINFVVTACYSASAQSSAFEGFAYDGTQVVVTGQNKQVKTPINGSNALSCTGFWLYNNKNAAPPANALYNPLQPPPPCRVLFSGRVEKCPGQRFGYANASQPIWFGNAIMQTGVQANAQSEWTPVDRGPDGSAEVCPSGNNRPDPAGGPSYLVLNPSTGSAGAGIYTQAGTAATGNYKPFLLPLTSDGTGTGQETNGSITTTYWSLYADKLNGGDPDNYVRPWHGGRDLTVVSDQFIARWRVGNSDSTASVRQGTHLMLVNKACIPSENPPVRLCNPLDIGITFFYKVNSGAYFDNRLWADPAQGSKPVIATILATGNNNSFPKFPTVSLWKSLGDETVRLQDNYTANTRKTFNVRATFASFLRTLKALAVTLNGSCSDSDCTGQLETDAVANKLKELFGDSYAVADSWAITSFSLGHEVRSPNDAFGYIGGAVENFKANSTLPAQ